MARVLQAETHQRELLVFLALTLITPPRAGPARRLRHRPPLPRPVHFTKAALEGRTRLPPDKGLRVGDSGPGVPGAVGGRGWAAEPVCNGPRARVQHRPGGNRRCRKGNRGSHQERRVRVPECCGAERRGGGVPAQNPGRLAHPVGSRRMRTHPPAHQTNLPQPTPTHVSMRLLSRHDDPS